MDGTRLKHHSSNEEMTMSPNLSLTNVAAAIDDVHRGFLRHEFWRTFAADEIVSRYRRSRLGQFWITLSIALFIFVIGGLYRDLLGQEDSAYFAYMAIGYILWIFISDTLNRAGGVFVGNKSFMMQNPMPYSVYCYKLVLSEVYLVAHHAVIIPPIFIYIGLWPGVSGILAATLGFLVVIYVSFWVSLILAILSLRFRDLVPITQSIVRLLFFATPIIWVEKQLGGFGQVINTINPVRYFIAIVRDPLLGQAVESYIYIACVVMAIIVTVLGLSILAATKNKIAYWL